MRNENIPDLIIERAVELWCRKLKAPIFDNGDVSSNGFMGTALATMNIESAKESVSDMDLSIDVFRKSLTHTLIAARNSDSYFSCYLSTDYHPCEQLSNAADEAKIPHNLFSCKSSVYMYKDRVGASFGYGADTINHYPIATDKWLLTTLSGSDIHKIISEVNNGNEMGFEIEAN